VQQRLRTNQDVYAFAHEIARIARALGDDATASILEDALRTGFTASELLNGLLIAFVQVKDRIDERYPSEMKELLNIAIEGIKKALEKANGGL
jgi:hypothetical protein